MPEFSVMLLWGSILVNVKYREGCSVRVLLLSCVWLCDPIDGSPPGSPVPWILQARTMEWVAISFSNSWKWKVKVKWLSHDSEWPHGLQTTRLLHPWDFPGKSTGVGCHCLLWTCTEYLPNRLCHLMYTHTHPSKMSIIMCRLLFTDEENEAWVS